MASRYKPADGILKVAAVLLGAAAPRVSVAQDAPIVTAPLPALLTPPQPADELDPDSPLAPLPDIAVPWPDLAAATDASDPNATTTDFGALQKYDYRVDGIDDVADAVFKARFDGLSTLRLHRAEPSNSAQIDRRAAEDVALLQTLMRGVGYYDAQIASTVETTGDDLLVVLSVVPGTRYRLQSVELTGLADAGDKALALREAFGVAKDDPVDADKIAIGEAELNTRIGEKGFPFAKVGQSAIVIDHATQSATLELSVVPGGARRIGSVITAPNKLMGARHIQKIARFKSGDLFDETALDDLRRALIQTGIVSSAEVKPVEGKVPGTVDIDVALQPAPPRTIAGELGFGTGEGVRAAVSWTHRNLFPPEGALTVRAVAGTQEQSGGVIFRRNNFEGRDRVLTAQLNASNVNRAAFQATTFSISGALERQTTIFFQKAWTWSVGAELAASDERDVILATGDPRRRTFFIAALPTSLSYDGTDDLLNPTKGFRLGGRLSPELSLQGAAFGYARIQLDGSIYRSFGDRAVVAARVRLGTIAGAPRDAIAPSRRFYSGGGASVRGYGFQAIGARDTNDDPIGGRSLTEFSVEARLKIFGPFGLVPFFDGGNVYTSALPGFSGFQYGAGIGLRYYSSFGPIRIDVGTPINPKAGDPRVAVYVSLGQAF